MSTINSRYIIDSIIAGDGYYEDDPRVAIIVEYTNMAGRQAWGITWITEPLEWQERYLKSTKFIRNPRVIWRVDEKLLA